MLATFKLLQNYACSMHFQDVGLIHIIMEAHLYHNHKGPINNIILYMLH